MINILNAFYTFDKITITNSYINSKHLKSKQLANLKVPWKVSFQLLPFFLLFALEQLIWNLKTVLDMSSRISIH